MISVIMPTYNTPRDYLQSAIESILKQSYSDFEFIIIDDCSTNDDFSFCCNYANMDRRIKVYRNTSNKGVAGTLNKGLQLAEGKYIFRMDSDDISHPDRFKLQVEYMENYKDVDMVGAGKINFGAKNGKRTYYTKNDEIRACLLFETPFAHPTVAFRSSSINKFNLKYNENIKAEDYDMWLQSAKNSTFKFANMDTCLLKYRVHEKQVTQQGNNIQESTISIIRDALTYIQCYLTEEQFYKYVEFTYSTRSFNKEEIEEIAHIYNMVSESCLSNLVQDVSVARKVISERFIKSSIRQLKTYKNYDKNSVKFILNLSKDINTKWKITAQILNLIF